MRACAGNVLLCGVTDNRHKFCAKVADFGLARDLGVVSRVETRTYGTLTHMAPEVLSSDTVSKVCPYIHIQGLGYIWLRYKN